jgi:hypothetical protein
MTKGRRETNGRVSQGQFYRSEPIDKKSRPHRKKILIGCEFSGVVRRAMRARGHDAWSCDLLPAEDNSPFHIKDDIMDVLQKSQSDGHATRRTSE